MTYELPAHRNLCCDLGVRSGNLFYELRITLTLEWEFILRPGSYFNLGVAVYSEAWDLL